MVQASRAAVSTHRLGLVGGGLEGGHVVVPVGTAQQVLGLLHGQTGVGILNY